MMNCTSLYYILNPLDFCSFCTELRRCCCNFSHCSLNHSPIGCLFMVSAGVYSGAMERLLEEGDYTRREKSQKNITGPVSVIYWLAVTAVFLIYTFGPNGNGQPRYSWIIWAVAGVLYAAVLGIVRLLLRSRKDQ